MILWTDDNSLEEGLLEPTQAELLHFKHVDTNHPTGKVEYDTYKRIFSFEDGSQASQVYVGNAKVWFAKVKES